MCYMSTQNKHLHVQVIKTTFANLADITNISCSGGSRGGARGAPAPAEIWLAPEVPLSCHSSVIYVSVKSFEIQPVQRKLYM